MVNLSQSLSLAYFVCNVILLQKIDQNMIYKSPFNKTPKNLIFKNPSLTILYHLDICLYEQL